MMEFEVSYIVPASGLKGLTPLEFLKGKYDFLDPGFVVETAVQMYVDYLVEQTDPDASEGNWQLAAEDAVFREYIGTLKKVAKDIVFRDKSPRTAREIGNSLLSVSDIVDNLITDVTRHISEVSTYISSLPALYDIEDIVEDTHGELLVQNAYLRGKNIRFRILEV